MTTVFNTLFQNHVNIKTSQIKNTVYFQICHLGKILSDFYLISIEQIHQIILYYILTILKHCIQLV